MFIEKTTRGVTHSKSSVKRLRSTLMYPTYRYYPLDSRSSSWNNVSYCPSNLLLSIHERTHHFLRRRSCCPATSRSNTRNITSCSWLVIESLEAADSAISAAVESPFQGSCNYDFWGASLGRPSFYIYIYRNKPTFALRKKNAAHVASKKNVRT